MDANQLLDALQSDEVHAHFPSLRRLLAEARATKGTQPRLLHASTKEYQQSVVHLGTHRLAEVAAACAASQAATVAAAAEKAVVGSAAWLLIQAVSYIAL